MSENRDIRFIKPCRFQDEEHRELTPAYAVDLVSKGRIVQINLENSPLQRMEQLPPNPTESDAEAVGLLPLVKILRSAPVALSAVGVNEMPDFRVSGAYLAYERFCATFWRGHKDDIEATRREYDETTITKRVEFSKLSKGARCIYGGAYVALLQMQNLNRTYPSLTPEERFEAYIHSIIGLLGVISAFELELAKYAFWDISANEIGSLPESIRLRRADIKENFTKLQGTVAKCKRFAFNGAMDLHWLSGANFAEDLGVNLKVGTTQLVVDNWVGTNDIKLYRISRDIHSVASEGSAMGTLACIREPALTQSPYWAHVDRLARDILLHRKRSGLISVDQLPEKIDMAVAHLEQQLAEVLPE